MNRREALRGLLFTGASLTFAPLLASCGTGRQAAGVRTRREGIRVDNSFARLMLASLENADAGQRVKLLEHPALAVLLRHQRLSGNSGITKEALLERVLEATRKAHPTSRVLDAWAKRDGELTEHVNAAALYLPPGVEFSGSVFFVTGYDIGVAAPPDIALNAAGERFQATPEEIAFCATHEAHHVGFLALRPAPELSGLNRSEHLRAIIRYFTQLEGMAVHAVYSRRAERGSLATDPDYRVYTDESQARRVTARYAELFAMLSKGPAVSDEEVGTILGAMSSGERIWYQFGALVSREVERSLGRQALVESIAKPTLFDSVSAKLLERSAAP